MLREPQAWCIQLDVFITHRSDVKSWRILEVESGKEYSASSEQLSKFGKIINRGHGQQLMLPIERWVVSNQTKSIQLQLL
jgi:hypothetical protein